jgi:hypothetical protein
MILFYNYISEMFILYFEVDFILLKFIWTPDLSSSIVSVLLVYYRNHLLYVMECDRPITVSIRYN